MRAAQKVAALGCRTHFAGLEGAPEVQNFLSGIVLGLRHQTPEDIEERSNKLVLFTFSPWLVCTWG